MIGTVERERESIHLTDNKSEHIIYILRKVYMKQINY